MAGDPRTLGNSGLRPEEIVDGEVLARLGKRFQKSSNRDWRKGTNPMRGRRERMQVRCYWYQLAKDGQLVPVKQLTTSRVVDRVEWVRPEDPASQWIRGWVVWGRGVELEEVRKEIGDKYWKMIRLLREGDWDGKTESKSRFLDWGQPWDWGNRNGTGS